MSTYTILHVEDDPNDAFLVQHAFQRARLSIQVRLVSDGQQALDYLAGTGQYADRVTYPIPQLVLLDLKMPKLSGFDVLSWVRGQEQFGRLPVLILSSSDHLDDRLHAQALGATEYEVKSPGFEAVVQCVVRMMATRKIPVWAAQGCQQNGMCSVFRVSSQ